MTFETCLVFILYVDYGFNNNKLHLHKASIFIHDKVSWFDLIWIDLSIKKNLSIYLRYIYNNMNRKLTHDNHAINHD